MEKEEKKRKRGKAAGKLSGNFLQPLFSMLAIYYSFQDFHASSTKAGYTGKLEARQGQRINEKDPLYFCSKHNVSTWHVKA